MIKKPSVSAQRCFFGVDNGGGIVLTVPKAFINAFNASSKVLDVSGSVGDFIRGFIQRDGSNIESIPVQPNNGSTLNYSGTLQNGDCIVIETSYSNSFASQIAQAMKCIPTAGIGFAPNPVQT